MLQNIQMRVTKINENPISSEKKNLRRSNLKALLSFDSSILDKNYNDFNDDHLSPHQNCISFVSNSSSPTMYNNSNPNNNNNFSPYFTLSPRSQTSPYQKSPWGNRSDDDENADYYSLPKHGLIGSLVREDGHIYSLAAAGDLLYTGSESKNVRVWKNLRDFSGFKASSGMVKAIVVFGDKIFTGHQDGKIRVWINLGDKKNTYIRIGNLPKTRDLLMKSMKPSNYVETRRKRNVPWVKHYDTVSCMSVDSDEGLLYSGSWDKSLKVWRISDSKCLESIQAHDDALNSVVVGFGGMIFTGSADGTVKAWRREMMGKFTKHVMAEMLLKQEHAVTSLAVSASAGVVYAGTSDGLVSFWEREKNSMSYGGVLRGHKLGVLCLAVGGNLVVSGSADKSICVWRRDVGGEHTCVAVLKGHGGPVKCLAVEKNKSTPAEQEEEDGGGGNKSWIVYSGSLDKSVKIWRVSEHAPSLKDVQDE